ncbi:RNA polymerase sigma factor [Hoyosella subflava]|uniref:Uncharacterized protein n=1 Tax=Hoyosella subflava (strain DSM 45089 / JCM 17490 / NBRC 109087 / DQS3-9A1) TaxID=443218 RepID=F6ESJ4_HOYSD|nr:sigma-70 family RNA polymerase sigma factor [Hoyosella subflava]AEF43115.1 hypothetical protein AS9A_P20071 [Hoyosella subflava DQS3-9A1]
MERLIDDRGRLTVAGQRLAAELYDPAVGTIKTWLAEGIAGEMASFGMLPSAVVEAAQSNYDVRNDIALDVFVSALPSFMRYLDSGKYSESGPATVQTFFIGACRNILAAVVERRHKSLPFEYSRADMLEWVKEITHLEGADYRWIHKLLQLAPHDLSSVLMLVVREGISFNEAAQRLGKKPATMRSHLHRYRGKLAYLHFSGKIDIPETTELGQWARLQAAKGGTA